MTSPCRTCSLYKSDKNNPACFKCTKRTQYVSSLGEELCFASTRSALEAPLPRVSLISRQAQFLAVCPEIYYE
jgi:hypothetical protein